MPIASLYMESGIWNIQWHRVSQMLHIPVTSDHNLATIHDLETDDKSEHPTPDWNLISARALSSLLDIAIAIFTRVCQVVILKHSFKCTSSLKISYYRNPFKSSPVLPNRMDSWPQPSCICWIPFSWLMHSPGLYNLLSLIYINWGQYQDKVPFCVSDINMSLQPEFMKIHCIQCSPVFRIITWSSSASQLS